MPEYHKCLQCGRSFARPENLSRHRKTHDAVLPHHCQICNKDFSRSDLLRKHMQVHRRKRLKTSNEDGLGSEFAGPSSLDLAMVAAAAPDPSGVGVIVPQSRSQGFQEINNASEFLVPTPVLMDNSHVDFFSWMNDTGPSPSDWFTPDFYEALHETEPSPNFAFSQEHDGVITSGDEHGDDGSGRVSRAPSPPNEASLDDSWPFVWNPASAPISQGQPVTITENDPLLVNHNPRFNMTGAVWERVVHFLDPLPQDAEGVVLDLPSLRIANLFIGLFFTNFSRQFPVLHEPTVDIQSLPPPLLAAMMVIGATYSNLRHTRRFSIVVLDRARCSFQALIENQNNLLREIPVIYASALICYTGLWCGNKRAFEFAEMMRSSVVTFVRRLPPHHQQGHHLHQAGNAKGRWSNWIQAEARKRLQWFVFMIDAQFPSLLNMKSIMSLSEIAGWECPCDEEFWAAPTSRIWNNLLGTASMPPAPTFAMTYAPFLWRSTMAPNDTHSISAPHPQRVNQWSSFLVLLALSIRALDWSQDWRLAMDVILETTDEDDIHKLFSNENNNTKGADWMVQLLHSRQRILDDLELWHDLYGTTRATTFLSSRDNSPATPKSYFHLDSSLLHGLVRMFLNVSLTDLQDAIGKNGQAGIDLAMRRLRVWASRKHSRPISPASTTEKVRNQTGKQTEPEPWALSAVMEAIKIIAFISCDSSRTNEAQAAGPYCTISLFLSHVVLWAFAVVASPEAKTAMRDMVERHASQEGLRIHDMGNWLESTLPNQYSAASGRIIFRNGAKGLTKIGIWGASLNLALLLRRRSDL
ncbi:hypothetical protein MKZ38_007917 [Zalerion maritima]|uniref:pH-response transcription factor pacC/RIM101 n=1 Tax=Zalerion maritima TaxID=339359 RepID=A0AAD5RH83_9PEZI|nr:hypothetical protein MKZ38_007917 [Zalerion maritima]